jgi:hypothetical protein
LYVGNLSYQVQESELEQLFEFRPLSGELIAHQGFRPGNAPRHRVEHIRRERPGKIGLRGDVQCFRRMFGGGIPLGIDRRALLRHLQIVAPPLFLVVEVGAAGLFVVDAGL